MCLRQANNRGSCVFCALGPCKVDIREANSEAVCAMQSVVDRMLWAKEII
jgi:hypothetical protein